MANRFVHYGGTIAQFKALSNIADYANSIVCISGDEEGKGAAIYTHGKYYGNINEALEALTYFSSISDGTTTASATGPNGTIVFSSDDNATVDVVAGSTGIKIGLAKAITDEISALRSELGKSTDSASSEGSIYAQIANLEALVADLTGGSTDSVAGQITKAIEDLDVDASTGDYVKSVAQVDGKIVATTGTFNFDEKGAAAQALADAKAYANGLASNYDAAGSAADAFADAKEYAEELNSALDTRVAANEAAIEVLNGTGEGSVDAKVAAGINDFAAKVSDDGTVNTYKELIDYAASHGAEFTELVGEVAKKANANDVYTKTQVDSAVATAKSAADDAQADATQALADAAEAKSQADKGVADAATAQAAAEAAQGTADDNADRISAIEADYLKAADKTALQSSIDSKVSQSDYDAVIAALQAKDAELAAMWEWEEL